MKLWKFPQANGIDTLELAQADVLRPGRGQVLVRMRAASLNYRDLMVASGRGARGPTPPNLIPLSDGAGEVVEVGVDVTRVKAGDRAAALFMQTWIGGEIEPHHAASSMGGAIDGVLTEYAVLHQDGLVHIPDHLSYEEAACLPCAGVTAWNALFTLRPLGVGQSVLVLGTGGVSMFALQFARATGARVIATSSSDDKLAKARALGATDTVNYRQHPEWQHEVLRLTDGRGVDYVVEVGGPGTLARSVEATRQGGSISLIGVLTGAAGNISPVPMMRKGLVVRGIYVGSRQMFEAMNAAIGLHKIKPVIDRVFPFADARAAYHHLTSQVHVGKVVISLD